MINSTKKIYKCLVCETETAVTHQKMNVYCSIKCSVIGRSAKTFTKFTAGQINDRDTLRRMLTKSVGYNCAICGLSNWQGKEITLQVNHIDGNAGNNMPDNLQLICPNCHSQTDTFGARNKGNGRKARGLPLK